MIRTCLGVPHAWLTPAKVYRQTRGFPTDQKYFVDWAILVSSRPAGTAVGGTPVRRPRYRRHPQAMSSNTPTVNWVRGHVAVMRTLVLGMLARPHLLEACGKDLFWCSWVAPKRAAKQAFRGATW